MENESRFLNKFTIYINQAELYYSLRSSPNIWSNIQDASTNSGASISELIY